MQEIISFLLSLFCLHIEYILALLTVLLILIVSDDFIVF